MNETIKKAIDDLNKQFGADTVLPLSEAPEDYFSLQVVPSGVKQLDIALGCGGIPRGRTIEIYGPYSCGKSTLATIIAASFHKHDPSSTVAFIEPENTFDMKYAMRLGIDPSRAFVSQPVSGEDAIDVTAKLLRAGVDLVVIDSVSALIPMSEANASMSDNFIGAHARMMSRACRVLTPLMNLNKAKRSNVIFINQIREKVGQMFGNPQITTGGNALPFYASIRLSLLSGAKDDVLSRQVEDPFTGKPVKEIYGQQVRINIKKNKVGNPNVDCAFDLIWGRGPDKVREVLDVGLYLGIIKNPKQGSYVIEAYGEEMKIRGIENLKERLYNDKELLLEIDRQIDDHISDKQKKAKRDTDVDDLELFSNNLESPAS